MVVKLEGIEYPGEQKIATTLDQVDQSIHQQGEGEGREQKLFFGESAPNTENVVRVLQPGKFFSEEAIKDLKVGDTFEVCPSANDFAKDIG